MTPEIEWPDLLDLFTTGREMPKKKLKSLSEQVGGDHYKSWPIEVLEFWAANWEHLPATEGAIVKYVCRWRDKDGLKDLRKARHLLDFLIEHEEEKSGKE